MFTTPPPKRTMVNTRSTASKLEREKLQMAIKAQEMPPPTPGTSIKQDENKTDKPCTGSVVKSERSVQNQPPSQTSRHSAKTKKSSSASSIQAQKRKLEMEAAKAKARIEMDLIDKQLAADLADLEEEYSPPSETSEHKRHVGSDIEKWVERSQQELELQHATVIENGKPHTSNHTDTVGPVQQLASALKDLVTTSTFQQNKNLLSRLSTPRELPIFSGDPMEWLQFKQAYEESTEVCTFTEQENIWRLRKCLRGAARDAVTSLLISATSPAVVIATLQLQFGNADVILSSILSDVKKMCHLPSDYYNQIVAFSIKVKNYVAAVRALGREEYLQGMEVATNILSRLPTTLLSKWADYSYPLISAGSPIPRLEMLSTFLTEEAVKISTCSAITVQQHLMNNHKRKQCDKVNNIQTVLVHDEQSEQKCRYCRSAKHKLTECKKFRKSLRKDRWFYVKRFGICYKCLVAHHRRETCPAPSCDIDNCGQAHHRLLHYVPRQETREAIPEPETECPNETDTKYPSETVTHMNINRDTRKVLLKTVPIYLHGPNGTVRAVALLDDGSTVTLISNALATRAGLRGKRQSMRVCGAWNSSEIVCDSEVMDLNLSNENGNMFAIRARSVNNLNLPVQSVAADELTNCELMKPEIKNVISSGQCKPELLIGQDNYDLLLPLEIIKSKFNELYYTRTVLGWCIHGCLQAPYNVGSPASSSLQSTLFLSEEETVVSTESERILRDMHEDMRQSFAIESVGVSTKPRQNIEEVRACTQLEQTAKLTDGRWYVGLPWKDTNSRMPDSYSNALTRLRGVQKKMKANPGYAVRYKERIDHLFSNDYASEIDDNEPPRRIWYLPHFGVDNPNKQKLRLVFDAAACNQGMCLNNYLLKGPDLLISLYGIMLRFRENKIGVTGDIKDMFLRIKIHKEDRDALRFLWSDTPEKPLKTYSMSSLIFGANCSPFVAQFIKNKNAERFESSMPDAVRTIYKQHYMDDCIDSIQDEQLAIKIVNDVTHIHEQGGFEIRNWTSNNQTVLNNLSNQSLRSAVSFKSEQQLDGERTLGLIWFSTEDTLGFDVSLKRIPTLITAGQQRPTKREMLRVLMSIFDVYGFLSPITIKGKIMLQETWKSGINWDDKIPDPIFTKWLNWLQIMKTIESIRLPRYYASAIRGQRPPRPRPARAESESETHEPSARAPNIAPPPSPPQQLTESEPGHAIAARYMNLQLHVFCDASTKAMCAVAYWRWVDSNGQICVAFISSKCRVAPVKYVSMPRLELQAALMAARLIDTVNQEHRIKPEKRFLWCDSTTVLHWINNEARNYKPYIAHRLGEIDELTKINEWRYIPTKMNVADIGTRESCDIETLQNDWLYGPTFLYEEKDCWPDKTEIRQLDVRDEDLECVNNIHVTPTCLPTVPEPERFSSWLRLLRTTCVVLTYVEKFKKHTCVQDAALMERAEILLMKYSQMKSFPDDLHNLKQGKGLDKKSRLLTLTPILDDDGILRLGGRIDAASGIPNNVKRPVILDGRCHITHLIVKYHHERACHGNQEMVVNELKQRYWILRLRPTVKYISSKCMFCRIKRAQPSPPRMGDLPEARLAHHQRPFTYTGLDLFGPLEVTVGRRREKRYGVIFTCLTVRAIHIEIVSQLTTDALIMALRRMAARRGWPRYLYSDNGTNLRGADTELKRCVRELDEQQLQHEIMTYSTATTWTFIPPASPHWGGAWERLIRIIKSALKVTLKERAPRDETLLTLMAEVEHMVNSRPLTHVTVEPHSDESMTPNHFLLGASSGLPALGAFDASDARLRKQWRISQSLADMFWKRWVREVLPDMRPRRKWCEETRPLKVGDLVLVVDPNSPRNVWPRGIVQAVIPGKDARIRVVDIRTKSGLLRRPATRVAPVLMDDECCSSTRGGNVGAV